MTTQFSFLVHPRNNPKYDMSQLFWRPFGLVPNWVWSAAFRNLPIPPLTTGRLTYLADPTRTAGNIITVPLSAKQLLSLPRSIVQAKLNAAVDLARDQGSSIIGLGALTSPAAVGGKSLAKRDDIGITNGNAFTAAITVLGIRKILQFMQPSSVVALVGATGSVGTCLVKLLCKDHSGHLHLVARNNARLERLSQQVMRDDLRVTISDDINSIRSADLIVLLTSSSEAIIQAHHLKEGAIVLDDTVPRNTSPGITSERPDVTIIDGGLVAIPGAHLDGPIGLPPKLAYACLAETMLLALEGHKGHFSIGTPEVAQAEYMLQTAKRHADIGFDLAPFVSFGQPINPIKHASGNVLCSA